MFKDQRWIIALMVLGLILLATGAILDDWTLVPSWPFYAGGLIAFFGGVGAIAYKWQNK